MVKAIAVGLRMHRMTIEMSPRLRLHQLNKIARMAAKHRSLVLLGSAQFAGCHVPVLV